MLRRGNNALGAMRLLLMVSGCRVRIERWGTRWAAIFLVLSGSGSFGASPGPVQQSIAKPADPVLEMGLDECLQRVIEHNDKIQIEALNWLVADRLHRASRGIFEPEFVGSVEHTENFRKTTVEQRVSLGTSLFDEENNLYSGGLEILVPSGAQLRLGYSLRDLSNNLQRTFSSMRREYQSFAGLNLTQPLLKNAGTAVTMASIRLAAGESELAFQQYRRQLIMSVSQAELAYWELYLAQEQVEIIADSLEVARKLHEDSQVRLRAGRASELDVYQAEAGVALRQARLEEAKQSREDAVNRMWALFSDEFPTTNLRIRAADEPQVYEGEPQFGLDMLEALEMNPEYLAEKRELMQEDIRLAFAKRQQWPQLDLKASFGFNGLGDTVGQSWHDVETGNYQNWMIGVELRIPLSGGIKARNELSAARLRKQQSILSLKATETEITHAMKTAIHRLVSSRENVRNFERIAEFNRRVFATEVARLESGRSDSRQVLEAEEDLSTARGDTLQSMLQHLRARLEWELLKGITLKNHGLDFTREQLESRTRVLAEGGAWPSTNPDESEGLDRRHGPAGN